MNFSGNSYYSSLEVSTDCNFQELKKAYFVKAKECHPDRFGGAREKEEEFKRLVHAFDVLSDPQKREKYDYSLGLKAELSSKVQAPGYSIMDTPADDTLEEIIVGNEPPKNATLSTLFLDLEKTAVFMLFREGKNYYYQGKYGTAMSYFRKSINITPYNILYRFFMARVCIAAKRFGEAKKHYKTAIEIGKNRVPPQRLERIRVELETIRQKSNPWWYGVSYLFKSEAPGKTFFNPADDMVNEANRAIANILAEQEQRRKQIETKGKS